MKVPISAIILTLNEENNIKDCLQSIRWADEVFVVDSGSTDKTLDMAKKYTDKIYQHPFYNFSQQRNWAQDSLPIKNEWIIHLDADERIEENLAHQIHKIVEGDNEINGLMAPRKTYFRGRWIKHGGHFPVYQLCVYKKSKGRSEQRFYDQNYMVSGRVLKLREGIINIINPDLHSWRSRHRKWAKLEAEEILHNKDRQLNIHWRGNSIERRNWLRYRFYYRLPIFARPFLYFFYRYIVLLGFLDGIQGLIFHFWQGLWFRLMVDKEIYKLKRNQKRLHV